MADVVALFNYATKHSLTVSDGWLFMIFLKIVRGVNTTKEDSFVDLASYASLWGESRICDNLADEKRVGRRKVEILMGGPSGMAIVDGLDQKVILLTFYSEAEETLQQPLPVFI